MNVFIILSTIFLVSSTPTLSIKINCDFRNDGWDFTIKKAYLCHAKPIKFNSKVLITSIEGTHKNFSTNKNVNSFLIRDEVCEFFPSGIENFFSSLEGIAIQKSGLKVIRKGDLKPFTKLKSLSVFGNDLTTLEFQLFMYNKNLQHFSAFSNKITNIAEDLIDGLNDLQQIHVKYNPCIDFAAESTSEIAEFKKNIHKDCPSTTDMKNYRDLEVRFEALEVTNKELNDKLKTTSAELEICSDNTQQNIKTTAVATEALNSHDCDSTYKELAEIVNKFDIECDEYYETMCISNDVIIQHQSMEPRLLKFTNGTVIDAILIQQLEIRGKNIHFMPQKLGIFFLNLKNLTITSSRVNRVDEFSLKNLTNLQAVTISGNNIQDVHKNAFDDLKSCESIDLSSNRITEIPETIAKVFNLRELNLENNQITSLNWKIFEQLGNLEVLNVNSNRLKQIGSNLELKNLQMLDLSGNICVDLQYPENELEVLIETFATNCTVEVELKCEFKVVKDDYICSAINFHSNSENTKISKITGQHALQKSPKDVTKFSSINQNLQFIPQNLQSLFPKMSKLEIISSGLKKLSQINKLTTIEVTGNNLGDVYNFTFSDNLGLEFIDLSNNKITTFPEDFFAELKNLKYLNLNGNFLEDIGENFIKNGNVIEEFHCNNNKLKKIMNGLIKNLKEANVIELVGNICVDNKLDRKVDNSKKYMELYGEVDLNC